MDIATELLKWIPIKSSWVIKGPETRDISHLVLLPNCKVFDAFRPFKSPNTANLKAGEVGLLLSHYAILEEIKNEDGYHLIMESDRGYKPELFYLLGDRPEADLYYLDYMEMVELNRCTKRIGKGWVPGTTPLLTHALLLNSTAAKKMLELEFKHALDWLYVSSGIKRACLRPSPFYLIDYPSTIQNEI